MGRWGAPVLACVASFVFAIAMRTAAAAEPTVASTATRSNVTLTVRGEPECVDANELLDRIALEMPRVSATPVAIEITGQERDLAFVITTSSGEATRRFAFEDVACETRLRVLALAIVLALEALVIEEPPSVEPKPTPAPTPPSPPPPPPPPREDAPPPPPTPPRTTWSLVIAPLAMFGAFPVAAFGGEVQPRVSGRFWSVRLGLAAFASPSMQLGNGRFRAVAWTAAPDACGRVPVRVASLRACGGVEAGVVWGRGHAYAQPRETTTPFVAPRIALELAAPVSSRVALVLGGALAVPILRTRFVAGDLQATGWPVTLRATAGIAVDLARGGER